MDKETFKEFRRTLPAAVRTRVDSAVMTGARVLTGPYPDHEGAMVYAVVRDRHSLVVYKAEGPGIRVPEEWYVPAPPPPIDSFNPPMDDGAALDTGVAEEDPEAPPPPTD